jgi:lysyl-tRNA synthetase, class II
MAVHVEEPGLTGPDDRAGGRQAGAAAAAPALSVDRGARIAQLASTLAFLAGLVNLISAAMPAERSRLRAVRFLAPQILSDGAVVAVAALGVALLLIAGGLRRRNRVAWVAVVVALAASAFFHLVKGLDLVEVVVQATLAGWLLGQGHYFTGRLGPRERHRVVGPAVGVLVATTLYGLLGIWSNEPGLIGRVGLGSVLRDVAEMAVGLGSDLPLRGRFADVFPPSVAALFWVGVLLVLLRALAPRRRVAGDPGPNPAELADSEDSLAYFATRDDRLAARDGAGLVSYGVAGAVALAAGNPIGPAASWPGAIRAFGERAAAQGRVPAVIGCSADAVEAYEQAGLHRIYLGDEAVLDLTSFDIEAKARQHARRGWHRGHRDGLRAEVRHSGDLDAGTTAELVALSDRWRAGASERGFSMSLGRLFDPRDRDSVVVIARDSGGKLIGFLNLVPWDRDGASLDVMRRDKSAPSVINEFLIVEAARQLPSLGIVRLSLNFAFLRALITAADLSGASMWARLQAAFLRRMSRWFQTESLYLFNQKFGPDWVPRYCAIQSMEDLPRVALAMGRAEGFVDSPLRLPWRRTPTGTPFAGTAGEGGPAPATAPDGVVVTAGAVGTVAGPVGTTARPAAAVTRAPGAVPARAPVRETRAAPSRVERARRAKLAELRDAAVDPYPVGFTRTATLAEVAERWGHLTAGQETADEVRVAGRIMLRHAVGGLTFWTVRQGVDQLQVMLAQDVLGGDAYQQALRLDPGDWVGVGGVVVRTRRGELSVKADDVQLLTKSLRPLPDKWRGLTDVETRSRQRELDLTMNPATHRTFRLRSAVLDSLRRSMTARHYVEVETPILQVQPGGATARPFITHHNAYDIDLYARVASELYLKRLLVGGMDRVFDLGPMFRNEGVDTRHNPEFTMLESNEAFADYRDMMRLCQDLFREAAGAVGPLTVTYQGTPIDLGTEWRQVTMLQAVADHLGVPDLAYDWPVGKVRELCDRAHVGWHPDWGTGKLVDELYDELVEATIVQPTFITNHPKEISPLAHPHRDDPSVTERFELVIAGREYANAYSELTDPVDQRTRMEAQALAKAGGDEEAMVVDEPYLRALELGLPPNAGLGIGVDRLVMLLGDLASIREAIFFPQLRPEGH